MGNRDSDVGRHRAALIEGSAAVCDSEPPLPALGLCGAAAAAVAEDKAILGFTWLI